MQTKQLLPCQGAVPSIRVCWPTDLALNQTLRVVDAPPTAEHLMELPLSPLVRNHLGSMHAPAPFALAEAASAERLRRDYANHAADEFVVVRGVSIKDHADNVTFTGSFDWFIGIPEQSSV